MLIGDRLRTLREEKKLSQGEVQRRSGLLRPYISRVENGHAVPSSETLENLARAPEVPLFAVFYEGGGPPAPPGSRLTGRRFRRYRLPARALRLGLPGFLEREDNDDPTRRSAPPCFPPPVARQEKSVSASSPAPQYNEKLRSPHNGELYFWVTHCPGCKLEFRLLWPVNITGVRLQAVVHFKCPGCQHWFSRQYVRLVGIGVGCEHYPTAVAN